MQRCLTLILVVALLAACAPIAPTDDSTKIPPTVINPIDPTATETLTPTVTTAPSDTPRPTETPTATHAPEPTDTSSPTPTIDPEALDDLQRGYMVLLMLESTISGYDELASQLQMGKMESGFEASGSLLALVFVLDAVKEAIEAGPPITELSAAWEEAQQALDIALDVASKWFNKEITFAEAPGLLEPAAKHVDKALDLAGQQMTQEYGVTESEMIEARQTAETEFRQIFQETPTPVEQ